MTTRAQRRGMQRHNLGVVKAMVETRLEATPAFLENSLFFLRDVINLLDEMIEELDQSVVDA